MSAANGMLAIDIIRVGRTWPNTDSLMPARPYSFCGAAGAKPRTCLADEI